MRVLYYRIKYNILKYMLGWVKTLTKNLTCCSRSICYSSIIIVVIRYLLHLIIYSNYLSSYLENFGNPKELVYFHMNGCGHCKVYPVWDEFSEKYNGIKN